MVEHPTGMFVYNRFLIKENERILSSNLGVKFYSFKCKQFFFYKCFSSVGGLFKRFWKYIYYG